MIQLSTHGREELKLAGLSPRELDAMEAFVLCKSQKSMGESMFITLQTLKFHITNINKRLGTSTTHTIWQWLIGRECIEGVRIETRVKEVIVTKEVVVIKETAIETLPGMKKL